MTRLNRRFSTILIPQPKRFCFQFKFARKIATLRYIFSRKHLSDTFRIAPFKSVSSMQSRHTHATAQYHKHLKTVFLVVHFLHLTEQHQWNTQPHDVSKCSLQGFEPLPQHIMSQPSVPNDVALHCRPLVPKDPTVLSGSQNDGASIV